MVLEVVGDTRAGNHPVVWLKLFQQGLVDIALGGVGKAGGFLGSDGHGSSPATTAHRCSTCSAWAALAAVGFSVIPIARLNYVGRTAVRPTGTVAFSCRWPVVLFARQRDMRGRS